MIDKMTHCFLTRELVKRLAIDSFDSIVHILAQRTEQQNDGSLDQLSCTEQESDKFFNEAKQRMLIKVNERKNLLQNYVSQNWQEVVDYMEQDNHRKVCLIQDREKSIQVTTNSLVHYYEHMINQIIGDFHQLQVDMQSMKQKAGETQLDEEKASNLFSQLNEEMCQANFLDFSILFDEFY